MPRSVLDIYSPVNGYPPGAPDAGGANAGGANAGGANAGGDVQGDCGFLLVVQYQRPCEAASGWG